MRHEGGLSARAARDPLLRLLLEPACAPTLGAGDWRALLVRGRRTGVLARVAIDLERAGVFDAIPEQARTALTEERMRAERNQTTMRFEVNRIAHALRGFDGPITLLKGAAYLMAGIAASRGRIQSDVDIMVPESAIGAVEDTMIDDGWEHLEITDYDEHYYRAWMHEIPPLYHPGRRTVTDVHHTILPRTSRRQPEADALLAAAVPLEHAGLSVLCPADMVLHSAVHLFNEEFGNASLRDLLDLDGMLREFAEADDTFWDQLFARARTHHLERPLFYAVHYSASLLGTPVSDHARTRLRALAPSWPVLRLMDALVPVALVPAALETVSPWREAALWLLFVRSHWLKMPPLLLARHLTTKAWRRVKAPQDAHAH